MRGYNGKHVFRAASVFEGVIAKRFKDKHNLNRIKTDYVKWIWRTWYPEIMKFEENQSVYSLFGDME